MRVALYENSLQGIWGGNRKESPTERRVLPGALVPETSGRAGAGGGGVPEYLPPLRGMGTPEENILAGRVPQTSLWWGGGSYRF